MLVHSAPAALHHALWHSHFGRSNVVAHTDLRAGAHSGQRPARRGVPGEPGLRLRDHVRGERGPPAGGAARAGGTGVAVVSAGLHRCDFKS